MAEALQLFLIEDDDDIALLIRKSLERAGHQVTRCRSAADALIVPIQAEYFALEGLGQLTHVIELVRSHLNAHVRILGVLITMFDSSTNLGAQVVDEVEKYFPGLVFGVRIPRSIRLSEAPSHGAPIAVFDPKGKGAAAYAALASEVLARE